MAIIFFFHLDRAMLVVVISLFYACSSSLNFCSPIYSNFFPFSFSEIKLVHWNKKLSQIRKTADKEMPKLDHISWLSKFKNSSSIKRQRHTRTVDKTVQANEHTHWIIVWSIIELDAIWIQKQNFGSGNG